jgi:hypothetical protein
VKTNESALSSSSEQLLVARASAFVSTPVRRTCQDGRANKQSRREMSRKALRKIATTIRPAMENLLAFRLGIRRILLYIIKVLSSLYMQSFRA